MANKAVEHYGPKRAEAHRCRSICRDMKTKRQPDIELLIGILVSDGARMLGMEYDDNEWWVNVIEGNTEVGVARYATEQEKARVDAVLGRLRKDRAINVNGKTYGLTFKRSDNFGDPAWTIRISERK